MTIEVPLNSRRPNFSRRHLPQFYGTVTFGRNDADGLRTTAIIFGRENGLFFGNTPDGVFNPKRYIRVWKEKRSRIGTTTPNEALDANGNVKRDCRRSSACCRICR